jgi:hypothetical protein
MKIEDLSYITEVTKENTSDVYGGLDYNSYIWSGGYRFPGKTEILRRLMTDKPKPK